MPLPLPSLRIPRNVPCTVFTGDADLLCALGHVCDVCGGWWREREIVNTAATAIEVRRRLSKVGFSAAWRSDVSALLPDDREHGFQCATSVRAQEAFSS